MAVTQTTRLGLTKWSVGSDPFARAQMNSDADALDALAAIDLQGTFAARPAAGTRGRYYWTTDKWRLFRDDGAAWWDLMEAPGALQMTAGGTLQAGWLWCDGATYDRAAYPDLFTALGGTNSQWGLPTGSTFKVPDLRGRAPVGAGTGSGLTARALAENFGAETVTLTLAQTPAHSHTVNSHSHGGAVDIRNLRHYHDLDHDHWTNWQGTHRHNVAGSSGYVIAFRTDNGANGLFPGGERVTFTNMDEAGNHQHYVEYNWGDTGWQKGEANDLYHNHGITAEAPGTNSQGSGTSHANVQPSVGMNFMVRT